MTTSSLYRSALAWLLATALMTMSSGCVIDHPLLNDLLSFDVSFAETAPGQPTGTEAQRLPYVAGAACVNDGSCLDGQVCVDHVDGGKVCAVRYIFDIEALGRDGDAFPYRGPLHIRVTPGIVADGRDIITMDGGSLSAVEVHVARAIGKTHIWFEADGFLPKPDGQIYGQCSDGVDNDANGLVDLADPGCQSADDDAEAKVNPATGISATLWFADPTIRDLQWQDPPSLSSSPLVGEQAQVSAGTLVVTNVVNNGFYLVDLADNVPGRLFNGLFVFTFSKPDGVLYGDKICGVSGAVQEHVGQTQLVFPSYEVYHPGNEACDGFPGLEPEAEVPPPWEVTETLLVEDPLSGSYQTNVYANSVMLEALEGNLVTFRDVVMSTRFIACDRNKDGRIDGDAERGCRDDCTTDANGVICTDLEGYFEFSQYAGITADKKKIYGSVALADSFLPLDIDYIGGPDHTGRCEVVTTDLGFTEYLCDPLNLESLTGSLRHIYLCGEFGTEQECDLQFWVIDPRFDGDVVVVE